MKALSLWQPWASLVILGHKQIETRGWSTNYRGRLAIHATAKEPGDCLDGIWFEVRDALWPLFAEIRAYDDIASVQTRFKELPRGCILGTVDLVDCQPTSRIVHRISEKEEAFGNFEDGRFGWMLANPVPFAEPIPAKGAQGLWEYDLTIPRPTRDESRMGGLFA